MTKEEIIKGWINKSKDVVTSNAFKGDKNNPPFFVLYINSLKKSDIEDLTDMVFPVCAHYDFDLKTGDLKETIEEPFVSLDTLSHRWLDTMMAHLYEAPADNYFYFNDGSGCFLTNTGIIQRKVEGIDKSWLDLVHVMMRASINKETNELCSFEDCDVCFGLYRLYNNFGSVCDNFNIGCSEIYDNFIQLKEELKEDLMKELIYEKNGKFIDYETISLREMYTCMKEMTKKRL